MNECKKPEFRRKYSWQNGLWRCEHGEYVIDADEFGGMTVYKRQPMKVIE